MTNRPKLSARTTPKLDALRSQSSTDATRATDEADDRRGRRSASARPARGTPRPPSRQAPPAVTQTIGTMASKDESSISGPPDRRGSRRPARSLRPARLEPALRCTRLIQRRPPARSAAGTAFGSDAHHDRHRDDRRDHAPTRAASRSGSVAVLLVGHRAVVHALEHPQHVDRRQDHAGRGERREPRAPSGRRRAESGTRRRSRSGRAGRSTTA